MARSDLETVLSRQPSDILKRHPTRTAAAALYCVSAVTEVAEPSLFVKHAVHCAISTSLYVSSRTSWEVDLMVRGDVKT